MNNLPQAIVLNPTATMYSEDVYQSIVENATDGIVIINENGAIEFVNPTLSNLFGYEAGELNGRDIATLMPEQYGAKHSAYMRQYELTGRSNIIGIGREVICMRKDGCLFPAWLSVSEVNFQGRRLFTGIIHDRKREKEAEEKLHQYNTRLEGIVEDRTYFLRNVVLELEQAKEEISKSLDKEREINRMKTRFVSVASHEFRTPLSSIQLSAALLERYYEQMDGEKVSFHLDKIRSAVGNLSSILNDFLSVEKVESGKTRPKYETFDLKKLCTDITEEIRIQSRPGQLIRYRHSGAGTMITLDSNLLRHCLLNLLSNAIKYTGEEGLIEFRTKIADGQCDISVSDNGIGIPENEQQRLFEPFFRAANAAKIEGTGLGLNIVKRYTALMNGQIKLTSNERKGTLVSLCFPAAGRESF